MRQVELNIAFVDFDLDSIASTSGKARTSSGLG
jgi:hypothetical protein